MQTKSAAWWAWLQRGSVEWRYGLDLLAADEITPLEDTTDAGNFAADRLLAQSANVNLDTTSSAQRGFTLALRNNDGRYLPGIAGVPSGGAGSPNATGLIWLTTRFRPWIDLRVGTSAGGKGIYDRTYLGIFVLVNPEIQVAVSSSIVQLTLLDKSALLQKPYRITASNIPTYTTGGHTAGGYASGSTFDSAMTDLATRAGIPAGKLNFEPSALTLSADYPIAEGSEWWSHLQALASSMAHVLYFDAQGVLVRRRNPLQTNAPSVYTVTPGQTAITATLDRKTDFTNTYNHVIVLGGSSDTGVFRGEATIQDQNSPYHSSQVGERVVFWGQNGLGDMTPDPNIGSDAQATTQAQTVLAQVTGQQESIDLAGKNIPALEPYDRITVQVDSAGLAIDGIIEKITWNLSNSGMTATAARWYTAGF